MNVRKLMGRLNAASPRYEPGSGGIPELTPQDIAAALVFIQDPLARDIFCLLWWPDGSKLTLTDLLRRLRQLLMAEFSHRARALEIARLELHIAECEYAARHSHSDHDHRILAECRQKLGVAKAKRWPADMSLYPVLCGAVLMEVGTGMQCRQCAGRGTLMADALVIECSRCGGRGAIPVTDRSRAESIARDESSYRTTWRGVYEWLYACVVVLEHHAAAQLAVALSRPQGGAPKTPG
ncbi:MAG: hypothetical protein ACREQ5_08385 [Candidatus Dormibacteria bacterium]